MAKDVVAYEGKRVRVLAVVRSDDSCPAMEFLDSLPVNLRARFRALIERLGNEAVLHNEEVFRKIQDSEVWEFKIHAGPGWRLWAVYGPGGLFLTHGDQKPNNRALKIQIKRAVTIMNDRRGTW